jgi:sRNA-binding carbon storage regulator CsrA
MLVLSRRNLQSLYLNVKMPDDSIKQIKVQIVGIGKQVRLGIQADSDVTILRDELVKKSEKDKLATETQILGN